MIYRLFIHQCLISRDLLFVIPAEEKTFHPQPNVHNIYFYVTFFFEEL